MQVSFQSREMLNFFCHCIVTVLFYGGPSLQCVKSNMCGGRVNLPLCWFSFNNSETVKAVTLAFCSIQYHFIRDYGAKFGIP